jgi:hypothetical protein
MRPEPQPSCRPSASSFRACFASDPWPSVPPCGFAGSIFRRATMAWVTRIATQSGIRSDASTILPACDRPQTAKGFGARSEAKLGHGVARHAPPSSERAVREMGRLGWLGRLPRRSTHLDNTRVNNDLWYALKPPNLPILELKLISDNFLPVPGSDRWRFRLRKTVMEGARVCSQVISSSHGFARHLAILEASADVRCGPSACGSNPDPLASFFALLLQNWRGPGSRKSFGPAGCSLVVLWHGG